MWWFVVKAVCADMKGTTSWKTYAMETFLNSYIEIKEKIVFEFCSICSMCTYIRSYRWRRRHTRRSNQWPENSILRSCQSSLDSSVRRAGKLLVCVRVCTCVCVYVYACDCICECMCECIWSAMYSGVTTNVLRLISQRSLYAHPAHTPIPLPHDPSLPLSLFLPSFLHSFIHSFSPSLLQVRTIKAGSLLWAGEDRILRQR